MLENTTKGFGQPSGEQEKVMVELRKGRKILRRRCGNYILFVTKTYQCQTSVHKSFIIIIICVVIFGSLRGIYLNRDLVASVIYFVILQHQIVFSILSSFLLSFFKRNVGKVWHTVEYTKVFFLQDIKYFSRVFIEILVRSSELLVFLSLPVSVVEGFMEAIINKNPRKVFLYIWAALLNKFKLFFYPFKKVFQLFFKRFFPWFMLLFRLFKILFGLFSDLSRYLFQVLSETLKKDKKGDDDHSSYLLS